MAEPSKTLGSIRFGPFELLLDTQELRKHGIPLKISGQAIHVLMVLTVNPGRLVTREELQQRLWPADSFGDFEHGLNAAVNKLREKLGDSATTPTYIETLQGRGYRFIAEVQSTGAEPPAPGSDIHVIRAPELVSEPTELPSRRWKWKSTALVLALVTIGSLYPWLRRIIDRQIRIAQLQRLKVTPLTSLGGTVYSPTFSPDGSQIAFVWDGDTRENDLYVEVIGSEKPVRLTQHGDIASAAWSPDGRNIAFSRYATPQDSGIFLIAPLGGPERRITSRNAFGFSGNELSWSADGKRLAFLDHPADSKSWNTLSLFVLSLDSLERTLVGTGCNMVLAPAFSPRGEYLAWVCRDKSSSYSLHLERLSDTRMTQLFDGAEGIVGIAWSGDSSRLVLSSALEFGDLREIALSRPGRTEKLPVGHDASDVAVSPATNRLAFTQNRRNVNIWRLDLSEGQPHVRKAISSSREQTAPNISPDGSRIAFESNRSGGNEIWMADNDGANAVQLTSFGVTSTGSPCWSPDGKLIVFDSRVEGLSNIYIVDPQGGVPKKLNIDIPDNNAPHWSHDGKWIYFENGEDSHRPTIWKVPSSGGHAVQIAGAEAEMPTESGDGRYVYFVRQRHLWRVGTDGSGEQQIAEMPPVRFDAWTPVGTGIYFISAESEREIRFFDLNTKSTRVIYVMEKSPPWGWVGGLPVSSDGKWLLVPQVDEQSSDLMLVENWQ